MPVDTTGRAWGSLKSTSGINSHGVAVVQEGRKGSGATADSEGERGLKKKLKRR